MAADSLRINSSPMPASSAVVQDYREQETDIDASTNEYTANRAAERENNSPGATGGSDHIAEDFSESSPNGGNTQTPESQNDKSTPSEEISIVFAGKSR